MKAGKLVCHNVGNNTESGIVRCSLLLPAVMHWVTVNYNQGNLAIEIANVMFLFVKEVQRNLKFGDIPGRFLQTCLEKIVVQAVINCCN